MKLIPVVETTDPTAPTNAYGIGNCCTACDTMFGARPTETEADLIAAAADIGEVTIQPMAQMKPAFYDFSMHWDEADFPEARRLSMAKELRAFGVEWDPTIRL